MMNKRIPVRLKPECINCIVNKHLTAYPEGISETEKTDYMQSVLRIVSQASKDNSAPVIVGKIYDLQREMFGMEKDFTEIKKYYNAEMMKRFDNFEQEIDKAEDPFRAAVQYAMTGNYIDFGAMKTVDEEKLNELLCQAKDISFDETEYQKLKTEVITKKKLVYLTDNCGEIVFDKLLIKTIQKMNPNLQITVLVRGLPVLNDATMDDAVQTGLTEIVDVMGNGSGIAGTCLESISTKALQKIEEADFVISKGQGNFETLQECGKNIYYLFLCKCIMFANRFQVPRFTGMLLNDWNI